MGAFTKRKLSNAQLPEDERPQVELANQQSIVPDEQKATVLAVTAGFTASLGGLIFGYVRYSDIAVAALSLPSLTRFLQW